MARVRTPAEADLDCRFDHHPPASEDVADAHAKVRAEMKRAAKRVLALTPEGREQKLALTKLEEAMFWANAAIARASSIS